MAMVCAAVYLRAGASPLSIGFLTQRSTDEAMKAMNLAHAMAEDKVPTRESGRWYMLQIRYFPPSLPHLPEGRDTGRED